MTADITKSGGYAVFQSGLRKSQGYTATYNDSSILDGKGAVVLERSSSLDKSAGYGVLSNPASVTDHQLHAITVNHRAVTKVGGYAVFFEQYAPFEDVFIERGFAERTFPSCLSFGSSGGPGFKSGSFAVDSGLTVENPEWDKLRASYALVLEDRSYAEMREFDDFFHSMRGKAVGFRFKDWADYQITDQTILVGDGKTTSFQLFKRYKSGQHVFDRIIKKPVKDTVAGVKVDGVELTNRRDYFVNPASGKIQFVVAPASGAICTMNYIEFDVPVRFDNDGINISRDDFDSLTCSGVDVIEVLL